MSIKIITPQELTQSIQNSVGIVVGPGITTYSVFEADLFDYIAKKFKKRVSSGNWHALADEVVASGTASVDEVRATTLEFLKLQRPEGENLDRVARGDWACVLSLAVDLELHRKVKEKLDAEPSNWQLTTIADYQPSFPINTLPYYALMGDMREGFGGRRLAVTGAEYLERRRKWSRMLAPIADILKGDPLVFLGTSPISERVLDLIDALCGLHPRAPAKFVFVESDVCVRSPTLQNLVGENGEILVVGCDSRELLTAVSNEQRSIYSMPIFNYRDNGKISFDELRAVADFVIPVPSKTGLSANPAERRRNLDALFRSSSYDWSPFALDMHFHREFEDEIYGYISADWSAVPGILELNGEAGCGKSVALKSIAFRFSCDGYLVLWLRRSYGDISGNNLSLLPPAIAKALGKTSARVLIIIDDPIACGFDPEAVAAQLRPAQFEWRIISCRRKSDLIGREEPKVTPYRSSFPSDFSDGEWRRLPGYLVSIGISESLEVAQNELARVPRSDGRDVLCALWYVLPQTKETLFQSLSNEYLRLGGLETTIREIAHVVSQGSKRVVKTAYEFVTVCAGLDRTPLPVEVLVGALAITYEEWTSQCNNNQPIWGLLVTEYVESAKTYVYRNRNDVVTKVLLALINGVDGVHAGEFRTLKTLLSACNSAQPQYVEFIKWILVDRREQLEERFTIDQLTELYDIALKICPVRLGIVEHHRAIARSHKGAKPLEVHSELSQLLRNTGENRGEHDDSIENVHTSAAAALIRAVRAGDADPMRISAEIFGHIGRALGGGKINWHAYHAHAKSLLELATSTSQSAPQFSIKCYTEASQITDRALFLLGPADGQVMRSEDLHFFEEIRGGLIASIGNIKHAQVTAEDLFDRTGDQTAYVMVLRIMASETARSDRNSDYKAFDDYVRLIGSRIINAGKLLHHGITAIRVENEFRWKVIKGSGSSYDLRAALQDSMAILEQEPYKSDFMWEFRVAVLAFLNRDYSRSDAYFAVLRRAPMDYGTRNSTRCFYLNQQGKKHVMEGRINNVVPPRIFIFSPDLETDILGYAGEFGTTVGKVVHFYLGFTLQGPIARQVSEQQARARQRG